MKIKTLAIGAAVAGLVLSSCSSRSSGDSDSLVDSIKKLNELTKANYKTIEIDNIYSIDLSDVLSTYPGLNDDASLEYANIYKEKYIIVIDEDKQEFVDVYKEIGEYDDSKSVIDNYEFVQTSFMSESGSIINESAVKSKKVNGMNSRQKQVDAEVEGVEMPISYWLGYVEGKDRLYTIMAWTLESRKADFEEEANKMINSLKEL